MTCTTHMTTIIAPTSMSPATRGSESLLSPVGRVGVVVVVIDLGVSRASIKVQCRVLMHAGVEPQALVAELAGEVLERGQQSARQARAAPVGNDVHPLDLADARLELLHAAPGD